MNEITSFQAALPHNVEAEQMLLGSILCDNRALHMAAGLTNDHFYEPLHGRIFEICRARILKGHLVSPVVLKTVMADDAGLKELGGPGYLARLAGAAISSATVPAYAKVIIDAAMGRALSQAAQEAVEGVSAGADAQEVLAGLQRALQSLPEASEERSSYSLLHSVSEAVDDAVKAYQGQRSYLSTGIEALDAIIKGLGPTDYMILGGATSMGKTSLAVEIAARVAVDQRKPVGFVSLEMSRQEVATRMISARASIPYAALRDAEQMEEDDFRKWVEASQEISDAPMHIVPKHVRDIAAIHAAAMRIKQVQGLALMIVDYAQLVRAPGKGRYEQMTEVSIGLKTMAGLVGCPVIALVQLDRSIGDRDDKRPHLSDIKESGQFENDADQVVFVHRDEFWLSRQGPKAGKDGKVSDSARADWETELSAAKSKMQLLVRKNRHGKIGTAEVGFHAATNRIWRLE